MTFARVWFAAIVTAAVLHLAGCDANATDGGTPTTNLDPVSNLEAYSASVTSVGLVWTPSPAARTADMQDHQVRVLSVPAGTLLTTFTVAKTESSFVVTGLTEGTKYQFDVIVRPTSAATGKGNSSNASVIWSPARRLPTEAGGFPIKVFETASPSFPSGLIIFKGTAPLATSVQNPSPLSDTLLLDLYLKTETSSLVLLRSAHQYTGRVLPRITRFSSVTRNAASLNDPAVAPPDTTTYSSGNTSFSIDNSSIATSKILFFKANDGNYGRLLVKRQSNGTLIGGTSPDRFLELEVSYQTTPYNPYSRRR